MCCPGPKSAIALGVRESSHEYERKRFEAVGFYLKEDGSSSNLGPFPKIFGPHNRNAENVTWTEDSGKVGEDSHSEGGL